MNKKVSVYLWDKRVGEIKGFENDSSYLSFTYDLVFLNEDIEIAPFSLPLRKEEYRFKNKIEELPYVFRDSLPDSYGMKVIYNYFKNVLHKKEEECSVLDLLSFIGKSGMGALEYIGEDKEYEGVISDNFVFTISDFHHFSSLVLKDRDGVLFNNENQKSFEAFVRKSSRAGGARAKALIPFDREKEEVSFNSFCDNYLIKFDNVINNGDYGLIDAPQYTLIEYAYYLMAKDCELQMNECGIYKDGTNNHFFTERFDRIDGKKIHMQSLGSLLNISYQTPSLCSYEEASIYMKKLGLSKGEIEEFFRRMVFNCLAVNQDDHVKNISFLMDKRGKWTLSPFYDVTFSYDKENKWLKAHQMTINNKVSDITLEDLLMVSKAMDISKNKALSIIKEVQTVVLSFRKYGEMCGIKDSTISYIEKIIKENSVI